MQTSMTHRFIAAALMGTLLAGASGAQEPAAAQPAMPEVGQMAPDFEFRGGTRYGLLANRTRLSDLRGQTVVLAFVVAARTRG